MPYAIRNSLVLLVMLILFAGLGVGYIFLHQNKRIDALEKEYKAIQDQLGDVEDLEARLQEIMTRVAILDSAWQQRPKTLPTMDEASTTNQYLNGILALSPEMDLNVLTQEIVKQNGCGYVRYRLAGQGSFASFMRMVEFLELGPRLMELRALDVREVHTLDDKKGVIVHTVQFDADLLAYFSDQAPFADSTHIPPLQATGVPLVGYNPFLSLVNPEIPPNVYNLPDVEKSTLLAVMKGRAFISDQFNELVMLQEGDEVYLGYVSKIMPERRQVQFLLNKGGLIERYVLTLKITTKPEDFQK